MSVIEPVVELDTRFSSPGATAPSWAEVTDVLNQAEIFWLSTVRGDGRPHVTPLPAIWHEGRLHICTGDNEQKAVNLAREPRCVLTTGTDRLNTGVDVVVEGTAERITDVPTLHELAKLWKVQLDWDFTVSDGGFDDGRDGTATVYGIAPEKVLAFGKGEPFSQTRYRFPA
ncbi:MAG: pyridoxamine 5-phosphate oxidase-related FMN-binding protein [Nocardia sp.]|uniref:pyridoxamine 5'-phosphate oxidase family protein n=1 Tax=Nocardia sp. TaxID=1821 RepID=UPI0026316820|nr:pyridoxamine 5'-phosphate oxidase family protein [Nocardia sp.]MCU1647470.1 pyridoxamine 5-phosphate oxidase-related FMN-binding protein [Nocardia sp.]